jgi:hypothetical protein
MNNTDAAARNIKVLSWFNLLMDFRFYGPVAVLVFQRICGSYAIAMAVFGAAMLSAVLFELPTGILSDRVGRRLTLILGQAAGFLSVLSYAIAGSVGEGGPAALFIGAGLEGLARAFFSGNNNALIHDSLKASGREEEFHRVLGKLSSYFQVAAALCALAGSSIAQASFALVLWLSVLPQAVALALSFAVVEPDLGGSKGAGEEIFSSMRHFLAATRAFFGLALAGLGDRLLQDALQRRRGRQLPDLGKGDRPIRCFPRPHRFARVRPRRGHRRLGISRPLVPHRLLLFLPFLRERHGRERDDHAARVHGRPTRDDGLHRFHPGRPRVRRGGSPPRHPRRQDRGRERFFLGPDRHDPDRRRALAGAPEAAREGLSDPRRIDATRPADYHVFIMRL